MADTTIRTFGARQRILLGGFGVLQFAVVEVLDAGLDLGRNARMFGRHSRTRRVTDGRTRINNS